MVALAYRDDKILARNLLSRPFFCLTPAEPFFRPDRTPTAPSCRVAVKDGRAFRGHPKGLSLTAASTMARWRYPSGRRPCVAAEHVSSPRRSSRLPASRSRSLYRSPGTPIGKPINYLDFPNIKLSAPAYLSLCSSNRIRQDPTRRRSAPSVALHTPRIWQDLSPVQPYFANQLLREV